VTRRYDVVPKMGGDSASSGAGGNGGDMKELVMAVDRKELVMAAGSERQRGSNIIGDQRTRLLFLFLFSEKSTSGVLGRGMPTIFYG
jgi:hypothetical protein